MAEELRIRDAERSDLDAIIAIYNHEVESSVTTFDTEPWEHGRDGAALLDRPEPYRLLVATRAGDVVGWGSLSRWSPKGAYARSAEVSVYVSEGARRGGIGRALLAEIVSRAPAGGIGAIISRVADDNPASVALHESAGFTLIGVQRRCGEKLGRVLDVTLMELVLDD